MFGMCADTTRRHLYFAYGSNMNAAVLARRLAIENAASFRRRRAVLPDHELVFNKMSSTDQTVGYGNVAPAPGHCVEGVLNELSDDELRRLDAIELVPHHYMRSQEIVLESVGKNPVLAHIYTAQLAWVRPELKPLRSYVDGLLGGADIL